MKASSSETNSRILTNVALGLKIPSILANMLESSIAAHSLFRDNTEILNKMFIHFN